MNWENRDRPCSVCFVGYVYVFERDRCPRRCIDVSVCLCVCCVCLVGVLCVVGEYKFVEFSCLSLFVCVCVA